MILIVYALALLAGFFAGEPEATLALVLLVVIYRQQVEQKKLARELSDLRLALQRIGQQTTAGSDQQTTQSTESDTDSGESRDADRFEGLATAAADSSGQEDADFPDLELDSNPASPSKDKTQPRYQHVIDKALKWALSWFTDGNVFVRVGLLVLFVGVAFLLKYAATNSQIPLEIRFLGAAMGGLALVVFGWFQRQSKVIFALLLQGGGIGIIYITIFASYRIADLIPSTLTFVLLVLFTLLTIALAVFQNARSLALYAVLGGFLAPILASSGSGNYVGLFSYYAVLNLLVFGVAWFRAWRLLNLLGFVFTFGVFAIWFVLDYQTHMLQSAGVFLLLFFVMYSVLGILYALKQTQDLRGLVDGTLVFGTPLIASSLGLAMLRHLDYGIAIGCLLLGAYYVIVSRFLWTRLGDQTRLLAEAMLAIGVVFATLAVPYALDGHWSSATWALEAAGILWVSLRQHRLYAQWFAMALQIGAGLLFLIRNADDFGSQVWLNPAFLGGLFIALGALISARLLYRVSSDIWMQRMHWLFYVWGMGWWLLSSWLQIERYLDQQLFATLILLTLTTAVLFYLDRLRGWDWYPAALQQALLIPLLIVLALYGLALHGHLLLWPDVVAWMLALVIAYISLFRLESLSWPRDTFLGLHTAWLMLVVGIVSFELLWRVDDAIAGLGDSFNALLTVVPLIALEAIRRGRISALSRFGLPLQRYMSAALMSVLVIWLWFSNMVNDGGTFPLPYLPIINPLDIAQLAILLTAFRLLPLLDGLVAEWRRYSMVAIGVIAFYWISSLWLRVMHHYGGIRFDAGALFADATVQTGLSILWTVIGMMVILYASRHAKRSLWIVGASLVAVVIVKLIVTDLRAIGTVERIVSFLAVGGLLVAMGYFSPIPPKNDGADRREETSDA